MLNAMGRHNVNKILFAVQRSLLIIMEHCEIAKNLSECQIFCDYIQVLFIHCLGYKNSEF